MNQGNEEEDEEIKKILKRLARRNLLRGYLLSIPTGQSVAEAMDVALLSEDELRQGNSIELNDVLGNNGFLARTPLWYYVLKEAEVRANGNSLGELGSRIVCETIIGQLFNDPDSYLQRRRVWDPSKGVKPPNPGGDPRDGDPIDHPYFFRGLMFDSLTRLMHSILLSLPLISRQFCTSPTPSGIDEGEQIGRVRRVRLKKASSLQRVRKILPFY